MKLSIITINRNNAPGLQKTIESVVSQTFTDFEYIVIDGASTDESVEVIKEFANHITYWISESDSGIYNAMNKGIRMAKGEYLLFLNSGDWLYDDEVLGKVFEKSYFSDVLYGNYLNYIGDDEPMTKDLLPTHVTLSYFYNGGVINHQSTFFKRKLFDADHFYDESFAIVSDWLYYMELIVRGAVFEYVDIVITIFDRTKGIGSVLDEYHLEERQRALSQVIPIHMSNDYEELKELRKEMDSLRNSRYFRLKNKNKFYKKTITLFLIVLSKVDIIVTSLWKKRI